MQNNRPRNDIQSRKYIIVCTIRTYASRKSCTRLCITISDRIFSQTWKSILIWSHLPVTSLTCNFLYSWISTRAVSPFRVLMASASCRRGNDLPCSWSSNRNSRRASRMLAEIRNSINALGSCRSSPGEIGEIGTWCLLRVGFIVKPSWPRNLCKQTETCTIPHFKSIQQPEGRKMNCKLYPMQNIMKHVKWSSFRKLNILSRFE